MHIQLCFWVGPCDSLRPLECEYIIFLYLCLCTPELESSIVNQCLKILTVVLSQGRDPHRVTFIPVNRSCRILLATIVINLFLCLIYKVNFIRHMLIRNNRVWFSLLVVEAFSEGLREDHCSSLGCVHCITLILPSLGLWFQELLPLSLLAGRLQRTPWAQEAADPLEERT